MVVEVDELVQALRSSLYGRVKEKATTTPGLGPAGRWLRVAGAAPALVPQRRQWSIARGAAGVEVWRRSGRRDMWYAVVISHQLVVQACKDGPYVVQLRWEFPGAVAPDARTPPGEGGHAGEWRRTARVPGCRRAIVAGRCRVQKRCEEQSGSLVTVRLPSPWAGNRQVAMPLALQLLPELQSPEQRDDVQRF